MVITELIHTVSDTNYFPRELSWLSFNGRVLQEAADERNPLIERLRFLVIIIILLLTCPRLLQGLFQIVFWICDHIFKNYSMSGMPSFFSCILPSSFFSGL